MQKRHRVVDAGLWGIRQVNYPVAGTTIDEIKHSMDRNKIMQYRWWAGFSHEASRGRGGNIILTYQFFIISPKLRGTPGKAALGRWNTYSRNIRRHEMNHIVIERAIVSRMLRSGSLKEIRQVAKFGQKMDNSYDKVTDHGRLEGGRLDFKGRKRSFTPLIRGYCNRIAKFKTVR